MKVSEVNEWLGVLTNLGVIIGLVFVGLEVRQNSIALDREYKVHTTEAIGNVREGWRELIYSQVASRDVAELWLRGNAQELEDQVDKFQFELMARESLRMIDQNFTIFSAVEGAPADWAVEQLVATVKDNPGLRAQVTQFRKQRQLDVLIRAAELYPDWIAQFE